MEINIDEDVRYRVPLFDGTNYSNWKFRLEVLLDEKDLLRYVETPLQEILVQFQITEGDSSEVRAQKEKSKEAAQKSAKRCRGLIIQKIAESHLEYIKDKTSAYDTWETLKQTFERKSVANQIRLKRKLLCMKFNSSQESLENHILKFDRIVRDLKSSGSTMEENDVICHLLLTMPSEYDAVVTAIETVSQNQLTLSFVKGRLFDEEAKRGTRKSKPKNEIQPNSVFVAHAKTKNFGHQQGNTRRQNTSYQGNFKNQQKDNISGNKSFTFTCHNCGRS